MAHNINFNEKRGTYSFVSRREIPWHGLGTIVENAMTSEEAIKACNADFEVGLAEIYAKFPKELWKQDDSGNLKRGEKVPDAYATYRKDTLKVFGLVGKRYEVFQNIEAFQFIDNIVQTGEAVIETAGVLGDGRQVFITAKLPDYITLSNGDQIDSYLFITTSHDGSGTITAALTKIRVVCNNTLNIALQRNTNKIVVKHTKNVRQRMELGAELMGLNNKFSKELEQALEYMKSKQVGEREILDLTFKLILNDAEYNTALGNNMNISTIKDISSRKKNIIHDIVMSIDAGPGQELYRGTGLWLYNGITSYLSNTINYSNAEDRLLSLTQGSEAKMSQQAFNLITNY